MARREPTGITERQPRLCMIMPAPFLSPTATWRHDRLIATFLELGTCSARIGTLISITPSR